MKTKFLLIIATAFAISFQSVSAQRLLISEEFNTSRWQAELLRLNPTYTTKIPGTVTAGGTSVNSKSVAFSPLSSAELYFGKYNISGAIEFIRSYYSQAVNYVCALENDYHNILVAANDSVPVGFRFNNTNTSFFEFPEISSAGNITLHVRSGNNTKFTNIFLKKWNSGTTGWDQIHAFKLNKRDVFWNTSVDEIMTFNINSRTPIKLELTGSDSLFCAMYQVDIEEHFSAGLKYSIDSATTIKNANSGNIGTAVGQYPQSAYDDFGIAITNATAVFDNTTTTETEVEDARLVMNSAIADFQASKVDVGTGINSPINGSIKQFGRKLVINKPATISIYNTVGTLVYQQDQVQVMEIPAYVGKGVFIVKSGPGVQKIYLGE